MKQYDLVVCGGGLAGCAAAIAAVRRGLKCALIEKTVFPGGLATSGIVLVYLPICDGRGHQLIFGLGEELLRLSNKYGPADVPTEWKRGKGRFEVYFSPASFVLALDHLLTESGIDVWYDTLIIGEQLENGRLRSIRTANKSGIVDISASCFVDATGDADLIHFSGNQCFTATNAMVSWIVEHRETEASSAFSFGKDVSTLIMASPINNADTPPGINGKLVSRFMTESRKRYRETLEKDYASGKETRKTRYPLLLPTMVPLRHTRCMKGKFVMDTGMGGKDVYDSIGLAPEWRGTGPVWSIPFRSLLPEKLQGVIAAGRCISSINDAWEITRVIPAAVLTGEVAGIASAISMELNLLPDALPYPTLAKELKKQGFPLKLEDID